MELTVGTRVRAISYYSGNSDDLIWLHNIITDGYISNIYTNIGGTLSATVSGIINIKNKEIPSFSVYLSNLQEHPHNLRTYSVWN